jgi:hypothetical protein
MVRWRILGPGALLGPPQIPGLSDHSRQGIVQRVAQDRDLLLVALPTEVFNMFWCCRMTKHLIVITEDLAPICWQEMTLQAGKFMIFIHSLYSLMTGQTGAKVRGIFGKGH